MVNLWVAVVWVVAGIVVGFVIGVYYAVGSRRFQSQARSYTAGTVSIGTEPIPWTGAGTMETKVKGNVLKDEFEGGQKVICINGDTTGSHPSLLLAKVYDGHVDPPFLPGDGEVVTVLKPSTASNEFQFDEVPEARDGQKTAVVWGLWGVESDVNNRHFLSAAPGTVTDCESYALMRSAAEAGSSEWGEV